MTGSFLCSAFVLFFALATAFTPAQEAGYKSLVDVEVRYGKAEIVEFGGSCSGSSHEPPPKTMLELTLLSLDRVHYLLGDDAFFDVRIENAGKEPVLLPWNLHPADFEERADGGDYSFDEVTIGLELSDSQGRGTAGWASLYGSSNVAGSLLEIRPGNWVQIHARIRLDTGVDDEFHRRLVSGAESVVAVKPYLMANTVTIGLKDSKGSSHSQCLKWGVTATGQETIRVSPRTLLNLLPKTEP